MVPVWGSRRSTQGSPRGAVIEIHLPRLAGAPDAAAALLGDQDVPVELADEGVVAFCREVLYVSASYGDELVRQVLVRRGAAELVLVGAASVVVERIMDAALSRGVAGSVRTSSAVDALR